MEFRSYKGNVLDIDNAIITMQNGDHLSVGVMVHGKFQTPTIQVQRKVILTTHDQTEDAFLIKPSGNQYMKG